MERRLFQTTLDMTEAAKQLRHANEQLAIAGAYPGRDARSHAARSVKPEARRIYLTYTEVQVPLLQRTMEYGNAPVLALCC
jgi:hypothetical protein